MTTQHHTPHELPDRQRDHRTTTALREVIADYTTRAAGAPEYGIAAAELAAIRTRRLPANQLISTLSHRVAETPLVAVAHLLRAAHHHITTIAAGDVHKGRHQQ